MQDYLNSTRRSIAWFKKAHDEKQLEMKPPFQRNPVWSEAQKSYLIDTILRGYPIPELYMQESVDETGKEHHVLVDGQQRVRACLEFLEGGFAIHEKESPEWADMSFDDLAPADKKRVFGYSFIVRQLPLVSDEEIRAIFGRLNRNTIALNAQELRHATYWGPFIQTVEKLSNHGYWSTSGVFTANDIRRMLDVEFISELVVAFLHGPQNKKASLEKWYAAYEEEFDERETVESAFDAVLSELKQVLRSISLGRWKKKSDLYTLFLHFAAHWKALPLSSDARAEASRVLGAFGNDVSVYLRTLRPTSPDVRKYGHAVERAASDLANRKARAEALDAVMAPVWELAAPIATSPPSASDDASDDASDHSEEDA